MCTIEKKLKLMQKYDQNITKRETSLAVQWLRLHAPNTGA